MSILPERSASNRNPNNSSTEDAQFVPAAIGHNGLTAPEWLRRVLYSGEVTRVGQHLALVIYHCANPENRTAQLSMRDLERITGWGRQTINDHLAELEIFVRIQLGVGRAKTTFELQGIITQAVAEIRSVRQPDATPDATPDTKSSVRQPDAMPDATPDTNLASGSQATTPDATPDTTISVREPDTIASGSRTQTEIGGTIGGSLNSTVGSLAQPKKGGRGESRTREAPAWVITEDGGFEGRALELSGVEVDALKVAYDRLSFPADLIEVDLFLAKAFAAEERTPGEAERQTRMTALLGKRQRDAVAAERAITKAARAKDELTHDDGCRWDGDRLVVANGYRAELLETLKVTDKKLDELVLIAGGQVPMQLRGDPLKAKVRAEIIRQHKFDSRDERKTVAIEQRGGKPASVKSMLMRR